MASRCFTPFKVPRVRITELDSCGTPLVSSCSSVTTDGIITVAQTAEYEAREEFYIKNADGVFCVQRTNAPILKWLNMTYTFCAVDPELVYLLTKQTILLNDADTPIAMGNSWQTNDAATVHFGFEAWTRVSAVTCTAEMFGYALWPYNVEGTMSDVTYENGAANFVVTARTQIGSNWGVGPYSVISSEATATLGNPLPLLTPVSATEHRRMFTTFLAPPVSGCGCTPLSYTMVMTDTGTGTHHGTITIPTIPYTVLPASVSWGDTPTSITTTVSAGPTALHNYSVAGTYTARLFPRGFSSQPFVTAPTPIA
jgi:hypothetical protein